MLITLDFWSIMFVGLVFIIVKKGFFGGGAAVYFFAFLLGFWWHDERGFIGANIKSSFEETITSKPYIRNDVWIDIVSGSKRRNVYWKLTMGPALC